MKPSAFQYHAAESVAEAISLVERLGEEAKILAGGQSLGPMLNYRLSRPLHLVDIHRVRELRDITKTADGGLSIGAAVRHAQLEDDRNSGRVGSFLAAVAHGIAFRAIRTRGTIGGSLANAHPASDWPAVVCALDSELVLQSSKGTRRLPAHQFFVGQLETVLDHAEILVRIELAPPSAGRRFGFAKISRKTGEYADSLAVTALDIGPDGRITGAGIWLGGAADVPLRLQGVEQELIGKRWSSALEPQIERAVFDAIPQSTVMMEQYKRRLHAASTAKAVADAYRGGLPS